MERQMVADIVSIYVRSNLGFAEWEIDSVRAIDGSGNAFEVDVVLRGSRERIDESVKEGPPEERELREAFLRDDFKATFKVVDGRVTDTSWENMEFI